MDITDVGRDRRAGERESPERALVVEGVECWTQQRGRGRGWRGDGEGTRGVQGRGCRAGAKSSVAKAGRECQGLIRLRRAKAPSRWGEWVQHRSSLYGNGTTHRGGEQWVLGGTKIRNHRWIPPRGKAHLAPEGKEHTTTPNPPANQQKKTQRFPGGDGRPRPMAPGPSGFRTATATVWRLKEGRGKIQDQRWDKWLV